jgi:putative ABC transport system permease protein
MRQQLKIAVRSLLKSPTFTIVALFVLALGIGAGTTIFSVVDAVVLRGLPFDEHDRIVAVLSVDTRRPTTFGGGSSTTQTYLDWRKMQQSFEALAMVGGTSFRLKTENGEPADVRGQGVTSDFFAVLRVKPLMGRAFTKGDEIDGQPSHVVLLSYGFWTTRFGGAPDIVGRTLELNEEPFEIVGVMPSDFQYPVASDHPTGVYVPHAFGKEDIERGSSHNYNGVVIGRLKPGVTIPQANDDMNRVTAALDEQYPKWEPGRRANVITLHEYLVGKVRDWMLMLLGAVTLVLLIACANVANLMLARATVRHREIGIRAALGAGRGTLIRELLLEGLLVSSAGAAAGTALAFGGVRILHAWLPTRLPRVASIGIDWRVLLFAAACALLTGILFSIVPAWRSSRPDITGALRDRDRSTTLGLAGQRLRGTLVVTEIALAVVLMVGAGLFIGSFAKLIRIDPGFDYHNVMTFSVGTRVNFRDQTAVNEALKQGGTYIQRMIDSVRRVPNVEMVGAVAGGVPLTGSWSRTGVTLPGKGELKGDDDSIDLRRVSADYLSLLKIPLVRGRTLTDRDVSGSPLVVVINQAAAGKYWPDRDPIGEHITISSKDRVVVGIVGNIRHLGPESPVRQEAYVPMAQEQILGADLVIRTSGRPVNQLASVKAAIWAVNPEQHLLGDVFTLEGYMDRLIALRRFTMALLALFGFLGLIIAAVGIYGVMAYVVAQRTNEIGVRMALGATPSQVLSMVLRRAVSLTAAGLFIGGVVAWQISSSVQKFLFQVQSTDAIVFVVSFLTLLVAGLLASMIPALRASSIDPLVALRHE